MTKIRNSGAVFVALIVSSALAIGVLTIGLMESFNNLEDLTKRVAALSQASCETQNNQRKRDNHEVRTPLQSVLFTLAESHRQDAENESDEIQRRKLLALAGQFERDAQKVTILKAIPCDFTSPDQVKD